MRDRGDRREERKDSGDWNRGADYRGGGNDNFRRRKEEDRKASTEWAIGADFKAENNRPRRDNNNDFVRGDKFKSDFNREGDRRGWRGNNDNKSDWERGKDVSNYRKIPENENQRQDRPKQNFWKNDDDDDGGWERSGRRESRDMTKKDKLMHRREGREEAKEMM